MIATVPLGAVQEMPVLSNAFSAEFGWTAGPALNIVTKSGTNALHGEALYMSRPGDCRRRRSRPRASARRPSRRCVTPATLTAINPVDIPDALNQYLRLDRRADRQGQDVLLRHGRLHAAGSDHVPLDHAAGVPAAAGRQPRPTPVTTARRSSTDALDHKLTPDSDADGASQRRSVLRRQPAGRRRRHERAERRAQGTRGARGRRRSITRGPHARTCSTKRASRT